MVFRCLIFNINQSAAAFLYKAAPRQQLFYTCGLIFVVRHMKQYCVEILEHIQIVGFCGFYDTVHDSAGIVFDKMLEKKQKEQEDIKKELSQSQSVLNTEEKLDAQSQQWIEDISEYANIKELDANLLNRLISKIVISEPKEKDGTENYRRTPETFTMEIHFNLKPIPELGTIERGSGSHK